jgi:hypothetical protein
MHACVPFISNEHIHLWNQLLVSVDIPAFHPWSFNTKESIYIMLDASGHGKKRSWPIPIWWIVAISAICATRDSSILMGYSIINHPFRGIPILGNPHLFGQNLYIPRQNSLSLKPLAGSSPNAIRHLWSLCELGIRLKKDAPKWQLVISCN